MSEDVDFFDNPDEKTGGSEDFKVEVTNLAREHRLLEGQIAEHTEIIKNLTKQKSFLESVKIPDAMHRAGVREITTLEGLKVSTKFIVGAIPAESKEKAYAWLDDNGFGDVIKRSVSVNFGKGDTETATAAMESIRALGLEPQMKRDVHAQTFMALTREQIGKGTLFPLDEWGVFHGDKAVIK